MNEHRDNSNRLTFDFQDIEVSMYSKITSDITSHFNLEAIGVITNGLNEIFQDFKVGSEIVGLEWDNWSGYIVNAKTKSAEPLVRKIASYISATFNS